MKALGLSLIAAAVTLAPLVACGGGGSNSDGTDVTVPDAKVTPDAPVTPDAFVLPAGCDYYEQNDTGNDAITTSGNTEQSQFSLAATTTTFCGQINSGHFVAPVAPATYGLVDYDVIQFTVAANTQAFVTLTGTGIDDTLPLSFFVGGGADKTAAADGVYDTRVMRATGADLFPAGDYVYVVGASAMAAITANHEYRLKITTDAGIAPRGGMRNARRRSNAGPVARMCL